MREAKKGDIAQLRGNDYMWLKVEDVYKEKGVTYAKCLAVSESAYPKFDFGLMKTFRVSDLVRRGGRG